MELFFDTETTGMLNFKAPYEHASQPDMIQLAAILADEEKEYAQISCLVNPTAAHPEWKVEPGALAVHGFSDDLILENGIHLDYVLNVFLTMADRADTLVCHNYEFDKKILLTACHRNEDEDGLVILQNAKWYCTMKNSTNLCKLPGKFGYKWPKLSELYKFLFKEELVGAHDALVDIRATKRCYYELKRRGL